MTADSKAEDRIYSALGPYIFSHRDRYFSFFEHTKMTVNLKNHDQIDGLFEPK